MDTRAAFGCGGRPDPNKDLISHGAATLYFHPIFALIPVLVLTAVLGMSFAIVGTGHRKAWILALPLVIGAWYAVARIVASLGGGALFPMFWGLALPVILCIAAWHFRRWRERDGA
jgi:hypothetical protein